MRTFIRIFQRARNRSFVWRIALVALVLSVAMSAAFMTAAYAYMSSLDVGKLADPMVQPTIIMDRNGEKVYTLSVRKSEPVPISAVPEVLIQAVIAVEDQRFFEHSGVDIASIARALYRDLQYGEFVEGGSTITQQLAKNAFLSPDKTFIRKLKEAAYALKIELTYEKEEILERYLNTIYFGEGAWGIQAASRMYFGKDVQGVTLEEAALLAALPKAPSRNNPVENPEGALQRRNLVLSLMAEQGMIDHQQAEAAATKAIVLREYEEDVKQARYSSYVDAVIQEAIDDYGLTEKQLMSGGWIITTAMDRKVQDAAVEIFADPAQFPESENGQTVQSGTVILDQHSGAVRALLGDRETGSYRSFNRATQLKRQPGSAFKPIAVYGPALEQGYTPFSRLYDGPLDIGGYRPHNWDGRYRGEVTVVEAIRQSWNIPAVWLLDRIGIEKGLKFSERLGIPLPKEDRKLGTALGGLSEGVSPLQMAQAFSVFANNGQMNKAHTIQSIRDPKGKLIAEYQPSPEQVMDPDLAYTMTLLLQNAVENGTGGPAEVPGKATAGKTGTTELPETKEFSGLRGAKDLWFVGYTPELTGAVWIGYDKTDRDHYMKTSSKAAASVFREIMAKALADEPPSSFQAPKGFVPPWLKREQPDRDDEEWDKEKVKKERKKKNKEREKEKEREEREKEKRERGKGKEKRDKDRRKADDEDDDD